MTKHERSLWVLVVAALAVAVLSADGRAQDARRRKKLIATGWDQPSSRELPGILRDVESRPFDGVVVPVAGQRGDGKPASLGWAFLNEKWSRAWFEPEIERLKGCKFRQLTDNFILMNANPGSVDWFDDAGWESIADHWRIAAWVYGEKFRWWPTTNGGVRKESWPDVLPGCDQVLAFVRDPLDYARRELDKLKSQGRAVNRARNGDFASDTAASPDGPADKYRENGPPAGWHTWQEDASHGTFSWDRAANGPTGGQGSARAANVRGGCFIQTYRARPGERYVVAAVCRTSGDGDAKIRVRWQTPDGRWTAEPQDRLIFAQGLRGAAPDGWSKLFGVVEVPESAGRLVILLGVAGQASPQDAAWFDNAELYRLP